MIFLCYLQGAAAQLLDVSSSLTARAPPGTPSDAAAQAVHKACAPTFLGHSGRAAAIAVLRDVTAVASLGRPAALRALGALRVALRAAAGGGSAAPVGAAAPSGPPAGVSRLAEARRRRAAAAAATGGDPAGLAADLGPCDAGRSAAGAVGGVAQERCPAGGTRTSTTRRVARPLGVKWDRQVEAAERKVFFTMCWANEAPPGVFAEAASAAEAELSQLEVTLASAPDHVRSGQVSYSGNPGKEALQAAAVQHLAARGTLLEPTGEALQETLKVALADPSLDRTSDPQSCCNPSKDSGKGAVSVMPTHSGAPGRPLVETLGAQTLKDKTLEAHASAHAGDHMDPTRNPGGAAPDGQLEAFHPVRGTEVPRKVMIEEIVAIATPETDRRGSGEVTWGGAEGGQGLQEAFRPAGRTEAPVNVVIEEIIAIPETGRRGPGKGTKGGMEIGKGCALPAAVKKGTPKRERVPSVSGKGPSADGAYGEGLPGSKVVDTSVTLPVVHVTPDTTPETRGGRGSGSGSEYMGIPRFEELD
jgi:hypothetical protein